MVWGPGSRPLPVNSVRRATMRSMVAWASRVGLVWGRSGAGFEGGVAVEGVAGDQPRYPALGDPVVAGDLGLVAAFDEYGGDEQAGFRHPRKSGRSAIPMS